MSDFNAFSDFVKAGCDFPENWRAKSQQSAKGWHHVCMINGKKFVILIFSTIKMKYKYIDIITCNYN